MRIQVPPALQVGSNSFEQPYQTLDIYQRDFTSGDIMAILNKAMMMAQTPGSQKEGIQLLQQLAGENRIYV